MQQALAFKLIRGSFTSILIYPSYCELNRTFKKKSKTSMFAVVIKRFLQYIYINVYNI